MLRIFILLLAISGNACAAPIKDTATLHENQPPKTLYLVSHGWHVGIVLPRNDITIKALAVASDFPKAQYLEVGWGDRDFYQTPEPHLGIILKAALLPTASVLHIVGFSGSVSDYFRNSEVIQITLPATGFKQLVNTIAASFAVDGAGNVQPLGKGLYGDSQFYLSTESYHLFNTCNVWVARALQNAGLDISPVRSIRASSLMSSARKLGTVIQAERLE